MAITWSPLSGHMRIGIDVRTDAIGQGTTSTTLYVDYYIRVESWRYADNQSLNMGVQDRYLGAVGYYNYQATNGTYEWLQQTLTFYNQPIVYGGGPTIFITGNISGAYDGSAPSLTIYYTFPARPAAVPDPPGVWISGVTATTATINLSAPNNNGATIDSYAVQLATDSGFNNVIGTYGGSTPVSGLSPSTPYYVRARAHNAIGWGNYSGTVSFTTSASVPGQVALPAVSNIDQINATVSWSAPSDGGSPISQYDIQIATNSGFTTGVESFADTASPYVLTLTPGTQYWVRVRAVNAVGAGAYSTAETFTTLTGIPTILSPTENQIKTDGIPSVTVESLGISGSSDFRAEFSKDNTFVTGVTVVTKNVTGPSSDNQYTIDNPAVSHSNGTWYVRVRVTNNGTAYTTPWSSTRTYTQSHTPSATQVSPIANNVVAYGATNQFQWLFVDAAAPNDTQTYYQLIIENNATGASVYDSGKTALNTTPSNNLASVNVALGVGQKNIQLRWKVRVWDESDQVSPYSGYSLFRLSDPPNITILSPTSSVNVDSGAPTFSWTTTIQSGGTQFGALIEVHASSNNALIWTKTVIGTATTATPETVVFTNNTDYWYDLTVVDTNGLSNTASQSFHTSYTAPASINYTINADDVDELGYIDVDWLAASPDAAFVSWKVYRRRYEDNDWTLLSEIYDQNIRNYRDFWIEDGVTYLYSVSQTAMRSGIKLESTVGYRYDGSSTIEETRTFLLSLSYYWLVHPTDASLSVRLENVTSDQSVLQFEKASYTLIGRGRHVDYGDELGYAGSITCQVRTSENQSSFRKAIETLRRTQTEYYLRTPFGRLFKASLGDITWNPLAGTGHMESGDLSFTYEEVA